MSTNTSNKDLFGDDESSSSSSGELGNGTKPSKNSDNNPRQGNDEQHVNEDDDDDDDDDDVMKRESEVKEDVETNVTNENSDGTTKEKDNSTAAVKSEDLAKDKVSASRKSIFDNDDDDDEGDAEFDDDGGIVGLTTSETAKKPPLLSNRGGNNDHSASFRDSDDEVAGTSQFSRRGRATEGGDDSAEEIGGVSYKADPEAATSAVALKLGPTLVVQQISPRRSSTTTFHITKLPNLVGIQVEPFELHAYSASAEEEEFGLSASHNLIRWRYQKKSLDEDMIDDDEDNYLRDPNTKELLRESNSRIVEWEDGSFTLHVGSEAFEVDLQDSTNTATGFSGFNGYLFCSQKASFRQTSSKNPSEGDKNNRDDESTQLEPAGTVLECFGDMSSRLTVKPSSLQSEAHKSLTVAVRQKTVKKARIAEFATEADPEKLKEERIKVKADLDKAAMRKQGGNRYYGGGAGRGPRRPRMSRSYLEEEEDDRDFDTTNLRAMKRGAFRGDPFYDDEGGAGESDEDFGGGGDEDDEDETFTRVRPGQGKDRAAARRRRQVVAAKDSDDDDDDEDDDDVDSGAVAAKAAMPAPASNVGAVGDEDDEDDEIAPKVKATKKRPHQAVFDDDDSD